MVIGIQTSPFDNKASDAGAMPMTVLSMPFSVMWAPDDPRIAAEVALPKTFPDHRDAGAARAVLTVGKRSTEHRLDAEQREQRRCHGAAGQLLGILAAREVEGREAERADRRKRPRLLLPRQVVQHRGGERRQIQCVVLFGDPDETVRMIVGQRPKHHRVDDAEDRGVGADGERDGEHHGEREQRRLAQHPHRIAKIVQHQRSSGAIIPPALA